MQRKIISILLAAAVIITTAPAVFANDTRTAAAGADTESTFASIACDSTLSSESSNELLIYDSYEDAIEVATKTAGVLEPILIRSGNTTKVELYLTYSGSLANKLRFKSIVVESSILGINYKVFKPSSGIYKIISFSATTLAYIKIGNIEIPTDKETAIVRSNGLYVYTLEDGWKSYTNINGVRTMQ